MHAPPGRNGEHLVAEMRDRIEARENAELLTNTPVTKLVAKDGAVEGVVAGSVREEAIRAEKVILATDGFAGNREMVRAYCEADIADALYYGSDGNTGDGIAGARSSAARSRRWTPSKATRPSSAGPARCRRTPS